MSIVTVERLGRRGDGVAETPDERVLVPLSLPGEKVEGEIADGRMVQPRILTPSPHRVQPACQHYRACGGCALMHADDGFAAGWKAQIVQKALAARGIGAAISGVATSPARSRRRAVFSGRRTKKGALVGFHARASDVVVEIADCQVIRPAIQAALPILRELTRAGASRAGELTLSVTEGPAGLDVAVAGGKPLDPALFGALAEIADRGDLARLTWGDQAITRREPALPMGRARVVPPPGGFLQATVEGERALIAAVREFTGDATRIVDLFAGCGTFTLPLAERAEVHAVEGLPAPLAALDRGWRAGSGLRRVTTEVRDLAHRPLDASELNRFSAIVIDPPRTGAEAQAHEIARSSVARVAWVSCDPVSFARDAAILAGQGWALPRLYIVDQFRWSVHVETVALFTRS